MTKQATLGPIDPSLNTPLNPPLPGMPPQKTYPVSVEAVKGYLAFAKEELAIKDDSALADIMIKLSESVHPLILGQVYRSQAQIKMLAEKLLVNQVSDTIRTQRIISFLCSDSGSHDYTINRREARDFLGLNVRKPSAEEYKIIKAIYDDLETECEFNTPLNLISLASSNNGNYAIRRAVIDSIVGGCDYYVSEGKMEVVNITSGAGAPPGMIVGNQVHDDREFEGWKHDDK